MASENEGVVERLRKVLDIRLKEHFWVIQYISWTHILYKPVRTGSQIRREHNKESGGFYCGNTEVTWKCIFFWACWSSSTHCSVFSFDLQFPPRCFFLLTYFETGLADLCYMWGAGQERWPILAFGLIPLIIMRGTRPLVRSIEIVHGQSQFLCKLKTTH